MKESATILKRLAKRAVIETGMSNGWNYTKYSDGTMTAERDVSTSSAWSQVGSSGIYQNQVQLTLPTGMSFGAGYASCNIQSLYLIGAQVQKYNLGAMLTIHRLTGAANAFTYHVVIEGTYQ